MASLVFFAAGCVGAGFAGWFELQPASASKSVAIRTCFMFPAAFQQAINPTGNRMQAAKAVLAFEQPDGIGRLLDRVLRHAGLARFLFHVFQLGTRGFQLRSTVGHIVLVFLLFLRPFLIVAQAAAGVPVEL